MHPDKPSLLMINTHLSDQACVFATGLINQHSGCEFTHPLSVEHCIRYAVAINTNAKPLLESLVIIQLMGRYLNNRTVPTVPTVPTAAFSMSLALQSNTGQLYCVGLDRISRFFNRLERNKEWMLASQVVHVTHRWLLLRSHGRNEPSSNITLVLSSILNREYISSIHTVVNTLQNPLSGNIHVAFALACNKLQSFRHDALELLSRLLTDTCETGSSRISVQVVVDGVPGRNRTKTFVLDKLNRINFRIVTEQLQMLDKVPDFRLPSAEVTNGNTNSYQQVCSF